MQLKTHKILGFAPAVAPVAHISRGERRWQSLTLRDSFIKPLLESGAIQAQNSPTPFASNTRNASSPEIKEVASIRQARHQEVGVCVSSAVVAFDNGCVG